MNAKSVGVVLLALVAVAIGIVIGVAANSGGGNPTNQPLPANVITVAGDASVSTAPDLATVSLGVTSEAPTAIEAQQANAQKATDVMKALEAAGVAKDDIQTTDLRLDKHYTNRGQPNETVSYIADNEMTVKVHDLTKVGDVTDAAVQAGANVVGGVEFSLSDQAKAKNDALQKAVVAARAKAQTLAAAAGATLGPVVRITEQSTSTGPYYAEKLAYAGDMAVSATTPVSPQNVQTEVSVQVIFQLQAK